MKRINKFIIIILLFLNLISYSFCFFEVKAEDKQNTQGINSYIERRLSDVDYEDYNNYTEDYKEYLKLSDEEKKKIKIIPRKYNVPFSVLNKSDNANNNLKKSMASSEEKIIPEEFDLRKKINIPVRNQGKYGLCWDFANMKSLETYLALNGYGDFDFSESHASYILVPDWLEMEKENKLPFVTPTNNDFEKYIIDGFGPVLESDVPYDREYSFDEFDYLLSLEQKAYLGDTIQFPSIDKLNNKYSMEQLNLIRNKIKEHIITNGSIWCGINADFIKNYNGHWTLNYSGTDPSNHAVSIIGWDDKYPKENFPETNRPQNNGAYIAMNSWGSEWGEDGVFYISYEDRYVEKNLWGITNASTQKEDTIDEIKFEDENLYKEIKDVLGKKIYKYNDNELILYTSKVACKSIYKLYLNNKNITSLKGLENFSNLFVLDLSNNNIENIDELEKLDNDYMRIYLNNNNIKNISKLNKFELIDVSGNPIEKGLDKLDKVERLYVGDCNLNNIQIQQVINLPLVTEISLRNNNIKDVSYLENVTNINVLDLSNNKELQNLDKLTNVNRLILEDCGFDNNIVAELEELPNLRFLDLSKNNITSTDIFSNLYLNGLSLRYTNINDVSSIGGINELDLSGNKNLINLDKLYNTHYLTLKDCDFNDFNFINVLGNLRELDLSDNKLTCIPDCSKSNCSYINLSNNEIKDISKIDSLFNTNCVYVYLNNNLIEKVPEISNKSTKIQFDGNYISEIPECDKNLYNMFFEKQNLFGNYVVNANKENRILLPQIIRQRLEDIQNFNFEIITENCTIDKKTAEVIINPNELGKGKARVVIKDDPALYTPMRSHSIKGTVFEINYETKDQVEKKLGDINEDGKINLSDVLKLRRYIANSTKWSLTDEEKTRADVNKDGTINLIDVLKLRRYIAASKNEKVKERNPDWIWE